MKRTSTLLLVMLFTLGAFSQAPEKMSYQAVIRNSSGELVKSSNIGIRISILQGSEAGNAVYVETHTKMTNENGLLALEIGGGTPVTGTFATIDWATGPYFLKTETDPTGGTNYTILGTSQLLSVPYALYAKNIVNAADRQYVEDLEARIKKLEGIVYNTITPPTEGLVAYYPFNGNANEESGNGNHGTVNGATLTSDRFGRANSAFHFIGQNSITTDYSGILGTADRTISFWVKMQKDETGGYTVCYGGGGSTMGTSIAIFINPGSIGVDTRNANVSFQSDNNNDGIWHNYVLTFSTLVGTSLNGVKMYRDGVLCNTITATYNYTSYPINTVLPDPVYFGDNWGLNAALDDIRFYNRVLNDSEIQQLYHEGGYMPPVLLSDIDGNTYNTVQIGEQIWMAENLKVTRYADGSVIPNVNSTSEWNALTPSSKAYCWYNNDEANKDIYGALYTWAAAMNGNLSSSSNPSNVQGVCPTGWHIPSDTEWTQLENYLIASGYNYDGTTIENKLAKSLASTTGWQPTSVSGSAGNIDFPEKRNATGFTAVPGGFRNYQGLFNYTSIFGFWWSSTEYDADQAWYRYIYYSDTGMGRLYTNETKENGMSIRCVKN